MKHLKLLLIAIIFAKTALVFAQKECALIGKWNVEFVDEKDSAVIEFRKVNDKVIGYFIEYTDENGNKYDDNSKAHEKISCNGKSGKTHYTIKDDGDVYEFDLAFDVVNADVIKARYTYYGFKSEEIWTRLK